MPERGFRRVRLIAALTLAGATGLAGGTLPTVVAEDDAPAITTTVDGTPCPDAPLVDGQVVTVPPGEQCPTTTDAPPPPTTTDETPPPTTTDETPAPPPPAATDAAPAPQADDT